MSAYQVDPLAYGRALSLVLTDKRPSADAVFIHGSPAASDKVDTDLLELAVDMVGVREATNLVINGLSNAECSPNGQRLAYPGSDTWGRTLREKFAFHNFLMIPSSKHTAAESDNLIKMAEENGWGVLSS